MRFHLLGLVHVPISRTYMGCAFTQKIYKLSKMLLSLGHEVYVYGAEGSDVPCTEFIETHTLREIRQEWGNGDNRFALGYDWRGGNFRHDINKPPTSTTRKFYAMASAHINHRKRSDDFLLVTQGYYHKPVGDAVKLWLTCEPGIGYRGSYARFRAFESLSLMHFTYPNEDPGKDHNGRYYDRVIPNYFELEDFPFQSEKGDYLFFIGRMIQRKGVYTAVKVADALNMRLVLAGQGSLPINSPNCEFIGYVDPEERARWMGGARAVMVPTQYLEPFGGVNVEAQLCGTPVITTAFGAFPETVIDGVTGFLCSTLDDFVRAAKDANRLDPFTIRKHAERYSTERVKWEFERWFQDLYQLYRSAFVDGEKGWHHLWAEEPAWRKHIYGEAKA